MYRPFKYSGSNLVAKPAVILLTKHLSDDWYFGREDHQPNYKFTNKRYPDEATALRAIGSAIVNGDSVQFIDTKEKTLRTYVKGSNRCDVSKQVGEKVFHATETVNF